jgi:hypothetical protein
MNRRCQRPSTCGLQLASCPLSRRSFAVRLQLQWDSICPIDASCKFLKVCQNSVIPQKSTCGTRRREYTSTTTLRCARSQNGSRAEQQCTYESCTTIWDPALQRILIQQEARQTSTMLQRPKIIPSLHTHQPRPSRTTGTNSIPP